VAAGYPYIHLLTEQFFLQYIPERPGYFQPPVSSATGATAYRNARLILLSRRLQLFAAGLQLFW
jgi:hypothetical protein